MKLTLKKKHLFGIKNISYNLYEIQYFIHILENEIARFKILFNNKEESIFSL